MNDMAESELYQIASTNGLIAQDLPADQAATRRSHNARPGQVYSDVQPRARVGLGGRYQLYAAVQNLFNVQPPKLEGRLLYEASTGVSSDPQLYEAFGWRFNAGLEVALRGGRTCLCNA